jgi:acid phosphatase family membrane protein YuiD
MFIISKVLLAVVLAFAVSHLMKMIIIALVHKQELHWADLVVTGGMPSDHSAVVVALVISLLFTEGVSNLFIMSAVLAAIVIRDALGVRRTAGEEGKLLNRIIKIAGFKVKPVHYSLGHTPVEVTVGVIIGAACGLIVLV